MKSLFHSIAQARGYPIGHGFRLWESIPPAIRDLPCFLDSLTGLWRYEYGEPIALSSGFMIGTPMFPDVETLFGVVGCASWRLSEPRFQEYTNRLIDKFKHEDTLTEFAPILRLPDNFQVTNEAAGSGPGNATIDWRIESPGEPPLMLEVKNRVFDLVEGLEEIQQSQRDKSVPAPSHDHRKLFRSVTKKFGARNAADAIHCVWIRTGLMQEEDDLRAAFETLAPNCVHGVILGTWSDQAYVLAADAGTKKKLLHILRLRQSRNLIFRRDEPPMRLPQPSWPPSFRRPHGHLGCLT